jgi:hypothetical protein
MSESFAIRFPAVEDQNVQRFCFCLQRIRTVAVNLVTNIVKQESERPLSNLDWAALVVLARLNECQLSIELLLAAGRERDAAVLLTTLLELGFDIRFLEKHPEAIDIWLAHDQEGKKPWKVFTLMRDLHPLLTEREAITEVYRRCSMVKHANPVGGTLTFSTGIQNRTLFVQREELSFIRAYGFAAGGTLYEATKAAASIWRVSGFDVLIECSHLEVAWGELQSFTSDYLKKVIRALPQREG